MTMSKGDDFLIAAQVEPSDRVRNPALVVVDMQNDFVRQGAPLEVPDARATIDANRRLISAFRERGRPVLFTRFISRQTDNLLWLWSPECHPDANCCWPGHMRRYRDREVPLEAVAIIDEFVTEADDIIIDKYGYGAFHDTPLDDRLKALRVTSLVVTGTVTQICVEETARQAFHHGYHTTIAADAVSSFAPDLHAATLKNFAMKFGWVAETDDIRQWL
jgi:nicotinamidase-related amidase